MTLCDPCHVLVDGWTMFPYDWRAYGSDVRSRRDPHFGDLNHPKYIELVTRQIRGIRETCLRAHSP